jgi:hypothetical protein
MCKESRVNEGARPVTPLNNCESCRNKKTYAKSSYAAAHLRRIHFCPVEHEGRGDVGVCGNPSMNELKKWMYEEWQSRDTAQERNESESFFFEDDDVEETSSNVDSRCSLAAALSH